MHADLLRFVAYATLLPASAFGVHRGWLLWARARSPAPAPPAPLARWPVVTVQLPLFNERHVAARLIAAAGALDYPRDRLEVQVLDDSTDDTTALALAAVQRLREAGVDARLVHRDARDGFKAGALAAGLAAARGEYIAVFDADFTPGPDFLARTLPWFTEGVGMVQARWGHHNVGESWLTEAQGLLLDGHFAVEQAARGGCDVRRRRQTARAGGAVRYVVIGAARSTGTRSSRPSSNSRAPRQDTQASPGVPCPYEGPSSSRGPTRGSSRRRAPWRARSGSWRGSSSSPCPNRRLPGSRERRRDRPAGWSATLYARACTSRVTGS